MCRVLPVSVFPLQLHGEAPDSAAKDAVLEANSLDVAFARTQDYLDRTVWENPGKSRGPRREAAGAELDDHCPARQRRFLLRARDCATESNAKPIAPGRHADADRTSRRISKPRFRRIPLRASPKR